MPASGNLTWQVSPTLAIWARPQSASSNLPSPFETSEPSPDSTGWVTPPVIWKVTTPPGRTVASAG